MLQKKTRKNKDNWKHEPHLFAGLFVFYSIAVC